MEALIAIAITAAAFALGYFIGGRRKTRRLPPPSRRGDYRGHYEPRL